ncbi:hypothetical protein GCM10011529_19010 [Polymorphobacter glacialis]|uniref:PepSY domain-containing protein n=1 Tax=Sandarakinorhabdus glacialis TaxID=1614636 RepID=A0A917E947_9SPHN|nr:PepSY domain-containing protein [Polymorphobacter glacialis]GGE12835.1 hypothetical protein GCM10011529_19010 [Polymorphobacter glacialis]
MSSRRHRLHLGASRLHKWLALIIGAQLLIWFASGALMSFWPIDEIHGDHLVDRKTVEMIPDGTALADPAIYLRGEGAERVTLRMLHGHAVAEVSRGGSIELYDAASGTPLPAVDASLAAAIAQKAWIGAKVAAPTTSKVTTASPEYRGPLPAWRVAFPDPDHTSVFVAVDTGQIAAVRTANWRLFDFFWGLHIMNWTERDNFNTWWLLAFAVGGLVLGLAGTVLLVIRWPIKRGLFRRRSTMS